MTGPQLSSVGPTPAREQPARSRQPPREPAISDDAGVPPGDTAPEPPPGRVTGRAKGEIARARDLRLETWQSVLAGLLFGWAAVAFKAAINEIAAGDTGYIALMSASVIAAWFGGLTGGLTATLTALGLNLLLISGSDVTVGLNPRVEQVRQILFLVIGTGTVIIVGTRRAARDRLADALDEVAALADDVEARDARLEIMLSAAGTGFWEWDIPSGTLTWSEAIYRQHGLDPSLPAPDFAAYLGTIHPDDRGTFSTTMASTLAADHTFNLDYRVVWPDGSIHWTHGAGRVFRDAAGNPIRMIGTGQDITERRRLEDERDRLLAEERRAAEFREAFIDVISHELRTPITTILGLAQILARPGRTDDAEARVAMLDDIRGESERMHRMVEDLLVLSRVERGRLEVDAEPLQPRRILERIVATAATELPSLTVRLDAPRDLPVVIGELTYVEQIMRNLLGNAAKYTPTGTTVVVSARPSGDEVTFRVTDDGPGIPEASRAYLFDLFYRDPTSARTVSGSGIGLFVCSSLVEAMGGRIWFADAPGGGAEFGFTLRAAQIDDADHPGNPDPVDAPAGDPRGGAMTGGAGGAGRTDVDVSPAGSPPQGG